MGRWYKGEVILEEGKVWKKSPNEKYWVSEYGDIVNAETGYKLQPTLLKSGYFVVGTQITGDINLHRVVYITFMGAIPDGLQINHIDGNKANNHISNLEVCTPAENTRHAYATGLANGKCGSENSGAKVTEDDVLLIYALIKTGATNDDIAGKVGLHPRYISLIRHGRRWSHLFKEQQMSKIKSVGTLPFPLAKCVYIYNKCLLSSASQDALAQELGIDGSTVSRIRTGQTWKRLREFYNLPDSTYDWRAMRKSLELKTDV